MKKSRLALFVTALALAPSVLTSTASAGVITLGPSLSTAYESGQCSPVGGGCTTVGLTLKPGFVPSSPVDGMIVSWSVKNGSATSGYAIRVLGRSGNTFTGAGTSSPVTPVGPGIETFPTAIPIRAGQYLGLNIPAAAGIGVVNGGSEKYAQIQPPLADNASITGPEFTGELSYNAQVQPAPRIATISPSGGASAGGSQVTITGTDFEGTNGVRFGATPATAFAVNSETQITAFVPAGDGAVPVSVTTNAGTAVSPVAFTYATTASPAAAASVVPPAPAASVLPPAPAAPVVAPAPTCTVPMLKGKTLRAAKRRIRDADCSVGKLTKKEGATAKSGEVVKQVPTPGATVPVDTKVKVTLAP